MNTETTWTNARLVTIGIILISMIGGSAHSQTNSIPNRLIDYDGFLKSASTVATLRAGHRVSEETFIQMAGQPETVVLDARSDDKFGRLHIKGAKHLDFSEFTVANLERIVPMKATRILIYCNNNFLNAPDTFATKQPATSLNIHTFNTLYNYGYTNVYELGPLIDIKKARLQFEGKKAL